MGVDANPRDLVQSWTPERRGVYDSIPSVPATREKILDAIAQAAYASLGSYGNCCRSVLWAIQTHLRNEEASTLRASAVLAGGIVGTGKTCGAVIGGLMGIGQSLASEDFRDSASYGLANAAAKGFADRFAEKFGDTDCYDVQRTVMGWCCDDDSKAAKWMAEGGLRACAAVVAESARLAAGIILDTQAEASLSAADQPTQE